MSRDMAIAALSSKPPGTTDRCFWWLLCVDTLHSRVPTRRVCRATVVDRRPALAVARAPRRPRMLISPVAIAQFYDGYLYALFARSVTACCAGGRSCSNRPVLESNRIDLDKRPCGSSLMALLSINKALRRSRRPCQPASGFIRRCRRRRSCRSVITFRLTFRIGNSKRNHSRHGWSIENESATFSTLAALLEVRKSPLVSIIESSQLHHHHHRRSFVVVV